MGCNAVFSSSAAKELQDIEQNQTIYILHVFHTRRHPKIKYKNK